MALWEGTAEAIQTAYERGYKVVLENKREVVFFKGDPPPLSKDGFFAGALIGAPCGTNAARQIVSHGLSFGSAIRYAD